MSDEQLDALDRCPHCESLVYSEDFTCPSCGKKLIDFSKIDQLDFTNIEADPDVVGLPDYDTARDIRREK